MNPNGIPSGSEGLGAQGDPYPGIYVDPESNPKGVASLPARILAIVRRRAVPQRQHNRLANRREPYLRWHISG